METIRLKDDPFSVGTRLLEAGLHNEAIPYFDEAIRLNPRFAEGAYNNRGNARRALGDLESAIADYSQAISSNSEFSNAYNNRGLARRSLGDLEGAIADYSQAIVKNPRHAEAFYNRGLARAASGDPAGAVADYSEAIAIDPSYAAAFNNRGLAQQALGNPAEAIADFNRCLEIDPNEARAYHNRVRTPIAWTARRCRRLRYSSDHLRSRLRRGLLQPGPGPRRCR
jgi:tetratricopeptide (TPR) repeat protein